ncbi:MAG TPA: bifunctional precorrin-2 dehydrogenase/sirohydrochlorin ferrochelatase [Bryobacteraceae bacterium]|nr:bifunctional precorrin-2 dehydrogenase/sirohydrochlorin ferrochelatase [Bryobacteraceae bacterium]
MVNLVMDGRIALVVGGGEIAARKTEDLLASKASVTVVAPQPGGRILALAEEKRIALRVREYRSEDLADVFVAVAATNDEAVNQRVAREAMATNLLVNVVDVPALCTFTVPAVVSRGDLTLAVATNGRCPALSSILRAELEGRYGPEYAELVEIFARLRSEMMAQSWDGPRIRARLAQLYRGGVMPLIASGDRCGLEQFLRDCGLEG